MNNTPDCFYKAYFWKYKLYISFEYFLKLIIQYIIYIYIDIYRRQINSTTDFYANRIDNE